MTQAADVVIVGSGMAGSTLAAELALTGFDVLTLEAGPERTTGDMVSSQIWSRRLRCTRSRRSRQCCSLRSGPAPRAP